MKSQYVVPDIADFRISKAKCEQNEYDILIYVKNSESFSCLYDENKWPNLIGEEKFVLPLKPSIPPQLSIVIKNVGYRIDFASFCDDLKAAYSGVEKTVRLRNKDQFETKLVKVEFNNGETRDKILKRGKIIANYISYDVDEYIGQAKVLICSKCMSRGHFKRQCRQAQHTCRVCGDR
ncbi:unnamed protein product [Didymodactylos carnosus]|uniref:CCHC-type domain-containing protein n=1 Tax=Didymodactylos carnosus TaxID=1234261 RepID=A0A815ILG1_9BILA|nr:unnamed protein product [Didymodactylos carnosus]CAF1370394.1 unnamed protein product [Didymodactylos carnosus]CAF4037823.1 unnamed protein product [Didymodactylos carnosus]CAF4256258.1 unnamed protein product [Didymodactylos carnosus]